MLWTRCDLALLLGALSALGCDGKPGAAAPTSEPTQGECQGDYDDFEPGMSKLAEPAGVAIELLVAEPSPPVVRDDNTWTLKLNDAEGAPLLGAELLVSPYMPKHQHGSAEVLVRELGEGEYRLSRIELIMPGVWEIPISVTPHDGESSETEFRLCIAEQ